MPDARVSVPAPTLGMHLHLGFRAGALAWARFAREPLPAAPLDDGSAAVAARVARHLATGREDLADVPVDLDGVPEFQRRALEHIRRVPPGRTVTYGEVADALGGGPGAARAVGGAMAANPIPLVVPCHRVVPANGAPFQNYSALGGVATKRALLKLEGALAQEGLDRYLS